VDFWVALTNPVPRVQHESTFHNIPNWFGLEISLDPRSLNFPRLARPASSRPASSEFREKAGFISTKETYRRCFFLVMELCPLSFRRDDWSNSNMVATALFGDGARPRC
jgi:hypothetical protein